MLSFFLIEPELTFSNPEIIESRVDLPTPDSPTKEINCPSLIFKLIFLSTLISSF